MGHRFAFEKCVGNRYPTQQGTSNEKRFLECVDKFLFQMVQEPTRKGATLDLVLINKKGLVSNMKFKGSLGCRDHDIMDFKILRMSKKVQVASLLLWISGEQTFPLAGNCLARWHGVVPWKEEGSKKAGQHSRTISSKSRSSASQEKKRQARLPVGLHESKRTSWT